jgi:hypothetical protein
MNINDLNKSQFLLLTLLVNFVTSIATGILTVSLLEKAPPTITQTINRVVERTIETVTEQSGQAAAVVTKETTVVVKDEDLMTASIAAHEKRVVTLYQGATSTPALAQGLLVSGDAIVIAPTVSGTSLIALHQGTGEVYQLTSVMQDTKNTLSVYAITLQEGQTLRTSAYTFADTKNLKPGQTAVALPLLGGVATGIVSRTLGSGLIETTISGDTVSLGTSAITLFGDVLGMRVGARTAQATFVPGNVLQELITTYRAEKASSAQIES